MYMVSEMINHVLYLDGNLSCSWVGKCTEIYIDKGRKTQRITYGHL